MFGYKRASSKSRETVAQAIADVLVHVWKGRKCRVEQVGRGWQGFVQAKPIGRAYRDAAGWRDAPPAGVGTMMRYGVASTHPAGGHVVIGDDVLDFDAARDAAKPFDVAPGNRPADYPTENDDQQRVGPIFPYHVVQLGRNTLFAMHADGTQLTHHHFDREGEYKHSQTFHEAHRKAENDATAALLAGTF